MSSGAARILVIEDEAAIAQFICKGLVLDGHEVVTAEDGDVGTFLASTERYDAVVLDLGLPQTSGLDVLRLIREQRPELPVIVLTGRDDPPTRKRVLSAGASAFMPKPLVVADLRDAVNDQLAR